MKQTRLMAALAALMLAACATPGPAPGFIRLHGPEAAPYEALANKRWRRANVVVSWHHLDRISREVHGHPLEFDPPQIPSSDGPFVFRDTATGRIVTDYSIGLMGYFEVEFHRSQPPKVAGTYFTDPDRTVRLPDILALHRYSERHPRHLQLPRALERAIVRSAAEASKPDSRHGR